MILTALLLADAVNKGGPGSGPQGGRNTSEKLPESITGSGQYGGSSLSRLPVTVITRLAEKYGLDAKAYMKEKTGPGGAKTGRNKLERAIMHLSSLKNSQF